MLAGLLAPDEGRITFDGIDLAVDPIRVKGLLGVVPQETAVYEQLSARENLRFWASLYGLSGRALDDAVAATLARVGLTERASGRVAIFSGGMKRRLNLAMGLVHSPRVLLLDEPTVGIDPQARQRILELVREVAAAGTTIVYTTHYLEEAERICDRIGIIDHGKLIAQGTLAELERQVGGEEIVTVRGAFDVKAAGDRFAGLEGVRVLGTTDGRLVLGSGRGRAALELLGDILAQPLDVEGVSIQPPGLNGLFLQLTGRELRD
jgi:ABC-2 type transport system ATP-binding protein